MYDRKLFVVLQFDNNSIGFSLSSNLISADISHIYKDKKSQLEKTTDLYTIKNFEDDTSYCEVEACSKTRIKHDNNIIMFNTYKYIIHIMLHISYLWFIKKTMYRRLVDSNK